MILEVPDEFRAEVSSCSAEDLQNLEDDSRVLASRFDDAEKIASKLIEAGWSPEFSGWYATRLLLDGPLLTLSLSPIKRGDMEIEEFEGWLAAKMRAIRVGWCLVLAAIVLRLTAGAIVASQMNENGDPFVALVTAVGAWIICLYLWFRGLFLILDSKGRSKWFALLGLWIFLLADRNQRVAPSKREGFVKEGAAVLSDW